MCFGPAKAVYATCSLDESRRLVVGKLYVRRGYCAPEAQTDRVWGACTRSLANVAAANLGRSSAMQPAHILLWDHDLHFIWHTY